MNIQLKTFRATKFELAELDDEIAEDSLNLTFSNGYQDNETSKSFTVLFELIFKSSQGIKLDVVYVGVFETDDVITEAFKESNFPRLNAPAIVYPYLRSLITTVSVNAGYEPIVIPTVNFQALMAKSKPATTE